MATNLCQTNRDKNNKNYQMVYWQELAEILYRTDRFTPAAFNKKLRNREEHSASVVLRWYTL